jgi:hypothetical protein
MFKNMTCQEAETYLADKEPGEYIIRYSFLFILIFSSHLNTYTIISQLQCVLSIPSLSPSLFSVDMLWLDLIWFDLIWFGLTRFILFHFVSVRLCCLKTVESRLRSSDNYLEILWRSLCTYWCKSKTNTSFVHWLIFSFSFSFSLSLSHLFSSFVNFVPNENRLLIESSSYLCLCLCVGREQNDPRHFGTTLKNSESKFWWFGRIDHNVYWSNGNVCIGYGSIRKVQIPQKRRNGTIITKWKTSGS